MVYFERDFHQTANDLIVIASEVPTTTHDIASSRKDVCLNAKAILTKPIAKANSTIGLGHPLTILLILR